MKYYFYLQQTRLVRWCNSMSIHPLIGILIGVSLFILLSILLFYKTEYAIWIYVLITLTFLLKLGDSKRNSELANVFTKRNYLIIRIIENALLTLPFQVYLLVEREYLIALALIPIYFILARFSSRLMWSKTIPTPFKKFPFEFIVGFRKAFWLIAIVYFIIIKAIQVNNYNLGLISMGSVFLLCMSFYIAPEPKYFVWIHSMRAKEFLTKKFLIASICVSMLTCLAVLGLILVWPHKWLPTLIVYLLGYIFLGSMIVAKYSAFPNEISIPQGIIYAVCLSFPPLLIFAIWIFYARSKKQLQAILE